MAYSDQQAMYDYRKLPPEDRPLVKNFAHLLEQHNRGKKVSHLYDQVDREPGQQRWPKMSLEDKKQVLTEFKRLQAETPEPKKKSPVPAAAVSQINPDAAERDNPSDRD